MDLDLKVDAIIYSSKIFTQLRLGRLPKTSLFNDGNAYTCKIRLNFWKISVAVALSISLHLGGALSVFAQSFLPAPCSNYISYLEGGQRVESDDSSLADCILYEKLVTQADNWSDFIDLFDSSIGSSSFVPIMAQAFDEQARSNYVEAFLLSDAAINDAVLVFTRLDDSERRVFYNLVLSRWRNLNLERADIPILFFTQLSARYRRIGEILPHVDHEQEFNRHMKTYIKCLFLNDAYTVQLEAVLLSGSFKNCL